MARAPRGADDAVTVAARRGPAVAWTHRPGRGDELTTLGDELWTDVPWPAPQLRWPRRFVDEDRADAHQVLTAALERAEDQGRRIPCRGDAADRWLAEDDTADARAAAAACAACPVLEQCRAYVDAHPERVGVWGGLTVRARRRRAAP
jgi:hypothetical protein